ncbi:hypothetical protein HKX48_006107 [Thoreauomyces humboldtii]|nr:hypothetical protein HKX48_006107 [Thoreauomyces humboldtii]
MNITQCADDLSVQQLVINSPSPVVQQLIQNSTTVAYIVAYVEAEARRQCNAGLEELYNIEAQVGGASIIIGCAWPIVALGVAIAAWRIATKPSIRAALLVVIMALTIADVTVVSWSRSSDLRYIYIDHPWLYGKLLIAFSVARSALVLIASCLRYSVVLMDKNHQRMIVAAGIVIGLCSMTGEYVTAYTSLQQSGAQSVSNTFWAITCINPIVYSILGLATFTLQLRKARIRTGVVNRQMRNLEIVNTILGLVTILFCIVVLGDILSSSSSLASYYPTPIQIAASAYWAVGENAFEVLALFKTSAESTVTSRQTPNGEGPSNSKDSGARGGGGSKAKKSEEIDPGECA